MDKVRLSSKGRSSKRVNAREIKGLKPKRNKIRKLDIKKAKVPERVLFSAILGLWRFEPTRADKESLIPKISKLGATPVWQG